MSSSIVAPVVVKPETLSNHAFMTVNWSPPQRTKGREPKMKESSQERTIITYPSRKVMAVALRTKMNGKAPADAVIRNEMTRAVRALSLPYMTLTMMDRNMKNALASSASPTFLLIALKFSMAVPDKMPAHVVVLLRQVLDRRIQF